MAVTINSSVRLALVSGSGVTISAPVVPNFTTDDIFNVNNPAQTLTQVLAAKQPIIGTGSISASAADVNALAGVATAGLEAADFTKLANINASAAEVNQLVGVTSAVQTQLNSLSTGKVTGAGVNLTGLTVSAAQLNSFFSAAITTTAAEINLLDGLTATSADLNVMAGAATNATAADITKLGDITASAAEINRLVGFTGTSTDLNKVSGLSTSASDLGAIAGLAATGVTATQFQHLSGLSQNVQGWISSQPSISGLSASVADLNVLAGIAAGTGGYSGNSIQAAELAHLNGVSSNIQTQLNGKMTTGASISLSQISGSSVTVTELNYLSGVTSAVQTQLNALTSGKLATSGGTLSGALALASGTAGAPSLNFSASGTTGLYRASADTIGISIAGVAFGSLATAAVSFGLANTGAPQMTTSAMGASSPTYTFVGDPDSGLYRVGANSVGISANSNNLMTLDGAANAITIGGAASLNVSVAVPGIFRGIKLLGSVDINCASTGNTAVYTVPTGRTAVVTSIVCVLKTVSGAGTVPRVSFGISGNFDQLVDSVANTTLFSTPVSAATQGQIVTFGAGGFNFNTVAASSGAAYAQFAAASVVTGRVTTATTGFSSYVITAYAFGYEF